MYRIEDFRELNQIEKMIITQHSRKRFEERGIGIDDVCSVIDSGEVIEQYKNDFPFPSCLILGRSDEKSIHVVASINEGYIYIITAYIPDPLKWDNDWKSRKEELK